MATTDSVVAIKDGFHGLLICGDLSRTSNCGVYGVCTSQGKLSTIVECNLYCSLFFDNGYLKARSSGGRVRLRGVIINYYL